MEFKKLKWKNNSSLKNDIAICSYNVIFNVSIYIQNWKVSTYDRNGLIMPKIDGKFYVYRSSKNYGHTRKIECNSLEEAKEIGQNLFNKMVVENFFEVPIKRKVLTEKSKYKNRKPKKKKMPKAVLVPVPKNVEFIGVGRTWKPVDDDDGEYKYGVDRFGWSQY